jgi:preprotein translocase subunit YajC
MPDPLTLLGATPAYAQGAPAAGGGGAFLTSFAPFLLIFALFYFLLIRPQQKRQKAHRQMLEALKKGDKVVTNGGLMGQVAAVAKDVVTLQVADNVRVRVLRTEIMSLQDEALGEGAEAPAKNASSKNGPAKGAKDKKKEKETQA